jgi:hypothetical protein
MKKPKFVVGFNSFQVKVEPFDMQPCLALENPPGEVWWEATVEVPKNAINISFCVTCENTWDNNQGRDHKVAISLPKGVEDVSAWAESFMSLFEEQERAERLRREEEERKREEARLAKRQVAQVGGARGWAVCWAGRGGAGRGGAERGGAGRGGAGLREGGVLLGGPSSGRQGYSRCRL